MYIYIYVFPAQQKNRTVSSLAARLVVRISGVRFLHEVHGVRPLAAVAVAAASRRSQRHRKQNTFVLGREKAWETGGEWRLIWLVVDLPLWKIWVGMMIPNIWKDKKCSKPPTS